MRIYWKIGLGFACVLVAACGYRTRERVVSAADVAAGRTRLTNFMSSSQQPAQESVPESLSRAIVVDEAEISRLDAQRICFRIVVRSDSELDLPLSEHEISINGRRVAVDGEQLNVHEHGFTGERVVVAADRVSDRSVASYRVAQPEERVFRVHERRTEVCGPRGERGLERLDVELPAADGISSWGQTYVWHARG